MKKETKLEKLESAVKIGQHKGFENFTVAVDDQTLAVVLRAFKGDEIFESELQRINVCRSDGPGEMGKIQRIRRAERWKGQFLHWLEWVFIKQRKEAQP